MGIFAERCFGVLTLPGSGTMGCRASNQTPANCRLIPHSTVIDPETGVGQAAGALRTFQCFFSVRSNGGPSAWIVHNISPFTQQFNLRTSSGGKIVCDYQTNRQQSFTSPPIGPPAVDTWYFFEAKPLAGSPGNYDFQIVKTGKNPITNLPTIAGNYPATSPNRVIGSTGNANNTSFAGFGFQSFSRTAGIAGAGGNGSFPLYGQVYGVRCWTKVLTDQESRESISRFVEFDAGDALDLHVAHSFRCNEIATVGSDIVDSGKNVGIYPTLNGNSGFASHPFEIPIPQVGAVALDAMSPDVSGALLPEVSVEALDASLPMQAPVAETETEALPGALASPAALSEAGVEALDASVSSSAETAEAGVEALDGSLSMSAFVSEVGTEALDGSLSMSAGVSEVDLDALEASLSSSGLVAEVGAEAPDASVSSSAEAAAVDVEALTGSETSTAQTAEVGAEALEAIAADIAELSEVGVEALAGSETSSGVVAEVGVEALDASVSSSAGVASVSVEARDANQAEDSTAAVYPLYEKAFQTSNFTGDHRDAVQTCRAEFSHATHPTFSVYLYATFRPATGGEEHFAFRVSFPAGQTGTWSWEIMDDGGNLAGLNGLSGMVDVTDQTDIQLARGHLIPRQTTDAVDLIAWRNLPFEKAVFCLAATQHGSPAWTNDIFGGTWDSWFDHGGDIVDTAQIEAYFGEGGIWIGEDSEHQFPGVYLHAYHAMENGNQYNGGEGYMFNSSVWSYQHFEALEAICKKVYERGCGICVRYMADPPKGNEGSLPTGYNSTDAKRAQHAYAARIMAIPGVMFDWSFDTDENTLPDDFDAFHNFVLSKTQYSDLAVMCRGNDLSLDTASDTPEVICYEEPVPRWRTSHQFNNIKGWVNVFENETDTPPRRKACFASDQVRVRDFGGVQYTETRFRDTLGKSFVGGFIGDGYAVMQLTADADFPFGPLANEGYAPSHPLTGTLKGFCQKLFKFWYWTRGGNRMNGFLRPIPEANLPNYSHNGSGSSFEVGTLGMYNINDPREYVLMCYGEDELQIDLSGAGLNMGTSTKAIAVRLDTVLDYEEIDLGLITPVLHDSGDPIALPETGEWIVHISTRYEFGDIEVEALDGSSPVEAGLAEVGVEALEAATASLAEFSEVAVEALAASVSSSAEVSVVGVEALDGSTVQEAEAAEVGAQALAASVSSSAGTAEAEVEAVVASVSSSAETAEVGAESLGTSEEALLSAVSVEALDAALTSYAEVAEADVEGLDASAGETLGEVAEISAEALDAVTGVGAAIAELQVAALLAMSDIMAGEVDIEALNASITSSASLAQVGVQGRIANEQDVVFLDARKLLRLATKDRTMRLLNKARVIILPREEEPWQ